MRSSCSPPAAATPACRVAANTRSNFSASDFAASRARRASSTLVRASFACARCTSSSLEVPRATRFRAAAAPAPSPGAASRPCVRAGPSSPETASVPARPPPASAAPAPRCWRSMAPRALSLASTSPWRPAGRRRCRGSPARRRPARRCAAPPSRHQHAGRGDDHVGLSEEGPGQRAQHQADHGQHDGAERARRLRAEDRDALAAVVGQRLGQGLKAICVRHRSCLRSASLLFTSSGSSTLRSSRRRCAAAGPPPGCRHGWRPIPPALPRPAAYICMACCESCSPPRAGGPGAERIENRGLGALRGFDRALVAIVLPQPARAVHGVLRRASTWPRFWSKSACVARAKWTSSSASSARRNASNCSA